MAKHKVKSRIKVRKGDYSRVLITETQPYELPLQISNDGFYEIVNKRSASGFDPILGLLIDKIVFINETKELFKETVRSAAVPFSYKINKGADDYRRLSLMHQRSQWRVARFYEEYADLILDYCAESPASIRAPSKIAGSFYVKKGAAAYFYDLKDSEKRQSSDDEHAAYRCSSFFSYRGVDRLYKFFLSREYLLLEKKFRVLRTLDVSKCFDSIYTHSISWAVKDKQISKENAARYAFGGNFDELMQGANHQETNGILIGPELSRIFAEVLLQKVDLLVIRELSQSSRFGSQGLAYGKDYVFKRYVDDIFVFANTQDVAKFVCDVVSDKLLGFNLHINKHKSLVFERPFVTTKSKVINSAKRMSDRFLEKLCRIDDEKLVPVKIYNTWAVSRDFIEQVKGLCAENQISYDEVSGFLTAYLTERVKRTVLSEPSELPGNEAEYCDFLSVMMEVMVFLYQVAPSVSSSYKLSTSIILIIRFSKNKLPDCYGFMSQKIFELMHEALESLGAKDAPGVKRFLHLEAVNLLLASRELPPPYEVSSEVLKDIFNINTGMSYFDIVSFLFYARDDRRYKLLRNQVIKYTNDYLSEQKNACTDSEISHLLFDMLCCPYVSVTVRAKWLRRFCKSTEVGQPSVVDSENSINYVDAHGLYFHCNWSELNLLLSLEKKELKRVY